MSDPYDFRPGGSLKLKRSADGEDGNPKKKKKKSKEKEKEKEKGKEKERVEETSAPAEAANSNVGSATGSGQATPSTKEGDLKKTDAQRKFEETQRKRLEQKIKKLASQTHKDRVHEFNSKLEKLSEHHDIPKVGPG